MRGMSGIWINMEKHKMSADQTIIEALPFRFLQTYVHSAPTYSIERLKETLEDYQEIGIGAFTVALYNKELRKSPILLLSQDVSKEIMAYIHMLYPKNPHFPAFKLLGQSIYFPSYIEQPEFLDVYKPVFLYSVPEYDSIIYDRKNKRWYSILTEKQYFMIYDWGDKVTEKDFMPIDDKKTIEQLNFLLDFYRALGTKSLYVDSKESLFLLSKIKANKHQQGIKDAFHTLMMEYGEFNKKKREINFYWDIRAENIQDDGRSQFSPDKIDFLSFYNVAIDKSAKNLVLLDVIYYADSQSEWG